MSAGGAIQFDNNIHLRVRWLKDGGAEDGEKALYKDPSKDQHQAAAAEADHIYMDMRRAPPPQDNLYESLGSMPRASAHGEGRDFYTEPGRLVEVSGVPSTVTEQGLKLYLENRNATGINVSVSQIHVIPDRNVAIVKLASVYGE